MSAAWLYALAREDLGRRPPEPAAADGGALVSLPDPTTTHPCRRTDFAAAIAALRGSIPADDRALLIPGPDAPPAQGPDHERG
jgi:hypothetical protein